MSSQTSEKPAVQYVRLGKSGLRVSVPIVGCMSFGSREWLDWVIEEDQALELLKAAWDRGVTTLDTANLYSNGISEKIIARFIKKYNIPRNKLVIISKCYFLVPDGPGVHSALHPEMLNKRDNINQSGLSRTAIFSAVEASLKRLEIGYLDLLLIHRYDANTTPEETMCALNDLVRSGKVRYIGASSMWTWQFAEYNHVAETNGWTPFIAMENTINLCYREEEREMIPYCKAKGIGLIPYMALYQGSLARPLDKSKTDAEKTIRGANKLMPRVMTEADEAIISRVEEVAKKHGVSMTQIAIAWVLTKVDSPIIGMSSPGRLEQAIPAGIVLTKEEIEYLEEPYKPKAIFGHK